MHIKLFENWLTESELEDPIESEIPNPSDDSTWVTTESVWSAPKVKVVRKDITKKVNGKPVIDPKTGKPKQVTINGAIRVEGQHGKRDYKLNVDAVGWDPFNVVPKNLIKKSNNDWTIYTNVDDQKHTLSRSDMEELITLYNSGKNEKLVKGLVADVTFTRTWDFSGVK